MAAIAVVCFCFGLGAGYIAGLCVQAKASERNQ